MLDKKLLHKAQQFLPENISKLIRNLQITAHWIGPHQFWFLKQLENGYSFIMVNALRKTQDPAFDHQRLAKMLSLLLKETIEADHLPFQHVTFVSKHEIEFAINEQFYFCNLKHYRCEQLMDHKPSAPSQAPSAMQAWGLLPSVASNKLRSPDGKFDISIENYNLKLTNTKSSKSEFLTTDGYEHYSYAISPDCNLTSVTNLRLNKLSPPIAIWSKDSQKILSHRIDQRQVRPLYLLQNVPEDGSYRPKPWTINVAFAGDENITTNELYIFDLKRNKTIKIDTSPINTTMIGSTIEANYAWFSDDAKSVFFIREHRGNKQLDFCKADSETGVVQLLLSEKSPQYVETSHLLFWLNYTQTLANTNEAVWLSERDGYMHIYLIDTTNGSILNQITQGQFFVRKIFHVDETDRWVYFLASGKEPEIDPYLRILYRATLDGNKIERLTPENADHTIEFSPNKAYFIDNCSTMEVLPTAKLYQTDGKELIHLTTANFEKVYALGWKPPEAFCLKADDGITDVYGVIYRPCNFDPNKCYPIIDDNYPGPQVLRTPKTYLNDPPETIFGPWWSQCYAELGFIVINIDGRGTPLRSCAFHHYSWNNMQCAGGLDDHIHAIKQLDQKYPYMQLDKVGIVGWSQGGYAAARAILAYPEFYKVAVSFAGDHELRTYLSCWGEKVQHLPVDDNFDRYSNIPLADRLQGKLLLIHGEMDDNVHVAGTFQLANALIKANRDFDMLIVPNENHGAYFSNAYVLRRMWEYFVVNLRVA